MDFKSIRLLKKQTVGIGSYGRVCKAKCDDLLCAAKILHETLFDPTSHLQVPPQRAHRIPLKRFESECEFLNTLKHPNIIQYLGVHEDADSGLRVLLMELMDENLTHYLENSSQPIPYRIQLNFCHDISKAISFLHSKNIIHRDLSSNNVLLIGNVKAKVTDFGMARFYGQDSQATRLTLTTCPGADVYMPPEAIQESLLYTEKIDCFSFGVIVVQILTRQFPNPGDRFKTVNDSNYPQPLKLDVPEVERRQNHISSIESNHPLCGIALDCLNDRDVDRPSAHQLCERLETLKLCSDYSESMFATQRGALHESNIARSEDDSEGTVTSKVKIILQRSISDEIGTEAKPSRQQSALQHIKSLQTTVHEKDKIIEAEQISNERLREQLHKLMDEYQEYQESMERKIENKERELERVKQHFEGRCLELEHRLGITPQLKLNWRTEEKAPCLMRRGGDAIVCGNKVYIRTAGTKEIHAYNADTKIWSQLPNCPYRSCSIAVLNDLLTTIGGLPYTNKLFSLIGKDVNRKWTEKFPPMPTKRQWATTLCTETILVVAGGIGEGDIMLMTVEVLNTETCKWFKAASLPEPFHRASATTCDDRIYMLGGSGLGGQHTKSVFTCQLDTLLQSTSTSSGVWSKVADLPVTKATCVSLHHQLLVIGGKETEDKFSTAIHMYDPGTNLWAVISHMTIARRSCFAAVLPNSEQVMVVGGWVTRYTDSDSVEIATCVKL